MQPMQFMQSILSRAAHLDRRAIGIACPLDICANVGRTRGRATRFRSPGSSRNVLASARLVEADAAYPTHGGYSCRAGDAIRRFPWSRVVSPGSRHTVRHTVWRVDFGALGGGDGGGLNAANIGWVSASKRRNLWLMRWVQGA